MSAQRKALWQKDRPWVLGIALGGLIALVAAIGDGGFLHALVLEAGRYDTEFHTMWICGLTLGLAAACFDGVLGVSEYLRQRPIDGATIFWSRVRTIAIVLAVWLVGGPIVAWILMFVFESAVGFDISALLGLWGSCVGAFSGAAIGLFAGMLPAVWWLRLLVGGSVFLTAFSAIHRAVQLESGYESFGGFVALHLVVAALFGTLAYTLRETKADADHAWSVGTRFRAGTAAVVAVVALAAAGLGETERTAGRWLLSGYPAVVLHEGEVRLVDRSSWRRPEVKFVGADHQLTGETAPRSSLERVLYYWPFSDRDWLGFDTPRWHRGLRSEWMAGRMVYLTQEGRTWLRRLDARVSLEATGKGPELAPFDAESRLFRVSGSDGWVLLYEFESNKAYRFDRSKDYFVEIELPNGDRLTGIDFVEPSLAFFAGKEGRHVLTLIGENAAYTPSGGKLVEIEPLEKTPRAPIIEADVVGGPIVATVSMPADGERSAFEHEFRPRTFLEYFYAGLALFFAGVQPFVIIAFDAAFGTKLLALGFGLLSAWMAWRRLSHLGLRGYVRQYWAALCVVLGPVVLPMLVVIDRARAHAMRPVTAAPAPRVFTPLSTEEAV